MKQKIRAIFSEDLQEVLSKTGEMEAIENGNRFCCFCGIPMNLNNIQLLLPNSKKSFDYVCDSVLCVEKHSNKKTQK
jgi:hypothetical protein